MSSSLALAALFLALMAAPMAANAYFNTTYLTTTVFLTNSTTAHVVESIDLFVSNASVSTYNQDRQAFNLSLTNWQGVVGPQFLTDHILNPRSSISNFTLLPGPLVRSGSGGGYASLTFSYYAQNITTVMSIAPREFEYTFNSSVFNYLHSGSGQSLLPNTRLTIMVPQGTQIVSIYPLPDYPQPNQLGQYNSTEFAWYSGEPLQKFSFVYLSAISPQQEVIQYFSGIYQHYRVLLYLVILLIIAVSAVYIYTKILR